MPIEHQGAIQDQGAGNHQRKHCGQKSAIDNWKKAERIIIGAVLDAYLSSATLLKAVIAYLIIYQFESKSGFL
jgi:hypothetical protein